MSAQRPCFRERESFKEFSSDHILVLLLLLTSDVRGTEAIIL
jgi:hypothetical protein